MHPASLGRHGGLEAYMPHRKLEAVLSARRLSVIWPAASLKNQSMHQALNEAVGTRPGWKSRV